MTEFRGPIGGPEAPSTDFDVSTGPPSERVRTIDPIGPVTGTPSGHAASTTAPYALPESAPRPDAPRASWFRRLVRFAAMAVAGWLVLMLTLIVVLRFVDPPTSAFMLVQRLGGEPIERIPVPLDAISSQVKHAVITSEDARFCRHHGVDWIALADAIDDTRAGIVRGGSTITMQTAKNLFLWPSRSYVRKALELPLALAIDLLWPKHRVLEVYLNLAEWGPGIFGVEAAAQYHFSKSAAELTLTEASLLAASLPSPISRDAGEPGRQVARLAERLRTRMANAPSVADCVLPARRPVARGG